MPAPFDPERWETLADGSVRRRTGSGTSTAARRFAPDEPGIEDLGLASIGAAHPPAMLEAAQPRATQAAVRLAQELGVALSEIGGTGKKGTITVDDVRARAK